MRRRKAVSQPMHGHFSQSYPSPALKFTRSRASCNKSSIALLQGRRCLDVWKSLDIRLVYFLWPWSQFSEMVVTWKSRSSWISWMDERWLNVAMSKCAKGPSKPLWRWAEHGCLLSMATTHHNYTPGTGSAYQTEHGSGIDWNDPNIQQPKQHSRLSKDMVKNMFFLLER